MTQTSTATDQMVIAEDAPIGQLVWPVRDEKYAPNFTIEEVRIIRTATQTYVQWVYENGNTREFKLGESVACRF